MQSKLCRLHGEKDLRLEEENVPAPQSGQVQIKVAVGGICGSDLHYYQDGGIGAIRVSEPIIPGHEFSGIVASVGDSVSELQPGDRVAVNPSNPCQQCRYCKQAQHHQCLNMRFYGSAMRLPHEQGGFREYMNVLPSQCIRLADHVSLAEAAVCEPLAVSLHAATIAGELNGKHVLITGAGPIGSLCAAVAKNAGAATVVVSDLQDQTLAIAAKMGATQTVNAITQSAAFDEYFKEKGFFDVSFECSASSAALNTAVKSTRPGGKIIQVGVIGEMPVATGLLVSKEISLCGSFRFLHEFDEAVRLLNDKAIDVKPIITQTYKLQDVEQAFHTAADRTKAVKVQVELS